MSSRPHRAPEEELLIEVASPHRDMERIGAIIDAGLDWPRALKLSGLHYITGQLAAVVSSQDGSPVPDRIRTLLGAAREEAIHRHRLQILILSSLLDGLSSSGIPVILIKGPSHAERFYKDPSERFCVDLDVVVRRSDVAGAGEVLERLGYAPFRPDFFRAHHFHIPYINEEFSSARIVELHWDVTLPTSAVRFDVESWWDRARETRFRFGRALVPPLPDEVAYQAYHAFSRGRVALRDIGDVARLLDYAASVSALGSRLEGISCPAEVRPFVARALRMVSELWRLPCTLHAEERPTFQGRAWLSRNLFSPSTVLPTGAALWWPYRRIGLWSLSSPDEGGLIQLLRPEVGELVDPTGRIPRPGHLGRWKQALVLFAALGLCCLPRQLFPAGPRST